MQLDFHYYATYCAAYLAGYSHEECMEICYSAQLVDLCSKTWLTILRAPLAAATTQLQLELLDSRTDPVGLQEITRIWASFHFLPYDLYAEVKKGYKHYKNKYRLICNANGSLVEDTVHLAKGKSLQAAGIAMHVLADTWAHKYFAGTPSLVINNTNYHFYELLPVGEKEIEKQIVFGHSPVKNDDLDVREFMGSLRRSSENSIMNLGHGRAGHLPDYSFMKYKYMPAWADYEEVVKDNPKDYYLAFAQMVCALKYLRGEQTEFKRETYDTESVGPLEDEIRGILKKRQLDASADWKALGERLSGCEIEDFELDRHTEELLGADRSVRKETFLGRFIQAAMAHKSMVTEKILMSGSRLAGLSIRYKDSGTKNIRALMKQRVPAEPEEDI